MKRTCNRYNLFSMVSGSLSTYDESRLESTKSGYQATCVEKY